MNVFGPQLKIFQDRFVVLFWAPKSTKTFEVLKINGQTDFLNQNVCHVSSFINITAFSDFE